MAQVLTAATDGWDAVASDLRAAAGKPAEELESVMVATQVGEGGKEIWANVSGDTEVLLGEWQA